MAEPLHGYTCTCCAPRGRGRRPGGGGRADTGASEHGKFDGKEAKVQLSGGTINVLYGGSFGNVPGDGHGHVRATGGPLGENIVFWRLPESEGGAIIVDNGFDIKGGNDLSLDSHLTRGY